MLTECLCCSSTKTLKSEREYCNVEYRLYFLSRRVCSYDSAPSFHTCFVSATEQTGWTKILAFGVYHFPTARPGTRKNMHIISGLLQSATANRIHHWLLCFVFFFSGLSLTLWEFSSVKKTTALLPLFLFCWVELKWRTVHRHWRSSSPLLTSQCSDVRPDIIWFIFN